MNIPNAVNEIDLSTGYLSSNDLRTAIGLVPLVSLDLVISDTLGRVLVGFRLNSPARGTWFTPGGRIRKGEGLGAAMLRIAMVELGMPKEGASVVVQRALLMGAWDHFYPDAAFSPTVNTHYVNLPYAASLSEAEVNALNLPVGEQHGHWQWLPLAQAADTVHEHVKPYVAWLQARAPSAAPVSPYLVHAA